MIFGDFGSKAWLKDFISLACGVAMLGSCVSGDAGRGQSMFMLGGVAVLSQIPQAAKNGEANAKRLWCGTLQAVASELSRAKVAGQGELSDADLVALKSSKINDIARGSGYRLHHIQIRQLILDAKKIRLNESVFLQEQRYCRISQESTDNVL